MDVLSQMLFAATRESSGFKHHWKCKKLDITHLCFADDLMLFCRGERVSAHIMAKALSTFSGFSGLCPNTEKSSLFLAAVTDEEQRAIKRIFPYQEGTFPMRYLGVPLISSRLKAHDCKKLVDRITARIQSWTGRFLSYAGRLQLIHSVLNSMHLFWASHFILPKSVARGIERIIRRFLWNGPDLAKTGAKVKWDDVAAPKEEGGLGIRKVVDWNKALICKLLWKLISPPVHSIWACWMKEERIKNRSLWHISIPQNASWSWRKLLSLRNQIRPLVKYHIGNGKDTWLWFDPWLPNGPIWERWGDRIIYDSGLPALARVESIIHEGSWRWPVASSPALMDLKREPLPPLSHREEQDYVTWLPSPTGSFTTMSAWEALRIHHPKVKWYQLIWASPSIPRTSFIAWMAIKRKLSTQDRLLKWGTIQIIKCWLCGGSQEDHNHLFLSCTYSRRLWTMGLAKFEMPCPPSHSFNVLLMLFVKSFAGKSFKAKLGRLFFNTTVYWLWHERNNRAHGRGKRDEAQIMQIITEWMRGAMYRAQVEPNSPHDHFLARKWRLTDN